MFIKIFQKTKRGITPVVATALLLVVAVMSVVGFSGWFSTFSSSVFTDIESDTDSSSSVSVEDLVGTNLYVDAGSNSSISKIEVNGIDCNINGSYSGLSKLDISFCLENVSGAAEIVVVLGDKIIENYQYVEGNLGVISSLSCSSNTAEGFFNGSGSLIDPFIICDCNQLQNVGNYLSGNFELNSNIDCSSSLSWNLGLGFKPLGSKIIPFTGEFNGNEFNVSNLHIDNNNSDLGLFGVLNNGLINNLNIKNINILSSVKYNPGQITNILVSNNILYALSSTADKVLTYDISNLNNFIFLDEYQNVSALDSAKSLFILGDILYVVSFNDMFATFNVSNPSNIILLDSDTSSVYLDGASSVFVDSEKIAYIANNLGDSISTFNVSNPSNIIFLDEYENTVYLDGANYIKKVNDTVFVASVYDDSLSSYDVSDPSSITFLDEYDSVTYLDGVRSFDILGDILFAVSSNDDSISSYNISNPSSITFLDDYENSVYLDGASYIIINQEVAYITSFLSKYIDIVKINVSDSSNLSFLETFDVINNFGKFELKEISIFNNILFSNFGGSTLTFATFDISNPSVTSFLSYDSLSQNVGAIAGYTFNSNISNSSVTGFINSSLNVGGIVGYGNSNSKISNSYSFTDVNGVAYVGGLVGYLYDSQISNSYSFSDVTGGGYVGGLVGTSYNPVILNSYSVSNVSGGAPVGGLAGYVNGAIVTNSYWDTQTSGQATTAGNEGTGLTTAQMMAQANFVSWDFTNIWNIDEGTSYPYFR